MTARQLPLEVEFELRPRQASGPADRPDYGPAGEPDEGAFETAQADLDDKIPGGKLPGAGLKHAWPKPPGAGEEGLAQATDEVHSYCFWAKGIDDKERAPLPFVPSR